MLHWRGGEIPASGCLASKHSEAWPRQRASREKVKKSRWGRQVPTNATTGGRIASAGGAGRQNRRTDQLPVPVERWHPLRECRCAFVETVPCERAKGARTTPTRWARTRALVHATAVLRPLGQPARSLIISTIRVSRGCRNDTENDPLFRRSVEPYNIPCSPSPRFHRRSQGKR